MHFRARKVKPDN